MTGGLETRASTAPAWWAVGSALARRCRAAAARAAGGVPVAAPRHPAPVGPWAALGPAVAGCCAACATRAAGGVHPRPAPAGCAGSPRPAVRPAMADRCAAATIGVAAGLRPGAAPRRGSPATRPAVRPAMDHASGTGSGMDAGLPVAAAPTPGGHAPRPAVRPSVVAGAMDTGVPAEPPTPAAVAAPAAVLRAALDHGRASRPGGVPPAASGRPSPAASHTWPPWKSVRSAVAIRRGTDTQRLQLPIRPARRGRHPRHRIGARPGRDEPGRSRGNHDASSRAHGRRGPTAHARRHHQLSYRRPVPSPEGGWPRKQGRGTDGQRVLRDP